MLLALSVCPNVEYQQNAESQSTELTETGHNYCLVERLHLRLIAALLTSEGKCSSGWAKPAHVASHLPPAPRGYQPNAEDPRTGDTFQLQHSGTHLLYTTWFGEVSALNNTNRSWCDPSALSAGWRQCGA